MTLPNRRFIILLASASILLLIPFLAMQFTSEVNWSLSDFAVMGVLLFGASFMIEMIARTIKNKTHRIILALVTLVVLLLVWAELAVGIFGTPFAGS